MKTYTRMIIGEAISDEAIAELNNLADAHLVTLIQNDSANELVSARRLWEEDGRMIVIEHTYKTREALLRYHSSRQYRQFVAATQHLLIGDFVVKLFATFDCGQLVSA